MSICIGHRVAFHSLASFLLDIITPVAGKSNTHIENSTDFIQQAIEIKIEEGEQMVSFDVVNMFISVLRKEAMQELQERLERDHTGQDGVR
jgi:hypothetical protein